MIKDHAIELTAIATNLAGTGKRGHQGQITSDIERFLVLLICHDWVIGAWCTYTAVAFTHKSTHLSR